MEAIKLGRLITDPDAGRDAVHIAILPVTTAQILQPGERVGFVDDEQELVGRVENYIGIIDPFLSGPIMPGTRVHLCLFPQTITSLRHVWTHPLVNSPEAEF
jgi:hypothetical protein